MVGRGREARMNLSLLIPAQNDESSSAKTIRALARRLNEEGAEKGTMGNVFKEALR